MNGIAFILIALAMAGCGGTHEGPFEEPEVVEEAAPELPLPDPFAEDITLQDWKVIMTSPDPFNNNHRGVHAYVEAERDPDIHGHFALIYDCTTDDPDNPFLAFGSGYTNFVGEELLGDGWNRTDLRAIVEGGDPRTLTITYKSGGKSWFPGDSDKRWIMAQLVNRGRMFVRWDQFSEGLVTAELSLWGSADAVAATNARCADPAAYGVSRPE